MRHRGFWLVSSILSPLPVLMGVFIVLGYYSELLPIIVLGYVNGLLTSAIPFLLRQLSEKKTGGELVEWV